MKGNLGNAQVVLRRSNQRSHLLTSIIESAWSLSLTTQGGHAALQTTYSAPARFQIPWNCMAWLQA